MDSKICLMPVRTDAVIYKTNLMKYLQPLNSITMTAMKQH